MHHPQIALQKTLCLFLVMLTHASLPFTSHNPFWMVYADTQACGAGFLVKFFIFFLAPAVIFASGFLLEKTIQETPCVGEVIAKRITRLIWPWLLATLFWLVPLYTLFDIPAYNRPEGTSFWTTVLAGLQGRFVEHLWFLLVLFWASLFWIIVRPLPRYIEKSAILTKAPNFAMPTWFKEACAKANQWRPSWIKNEWFALKWEKASFTMTEILGMGVAFIVALTIQIAGKDLTWFCFQQSAGPILFLYCGILAYRHREWLDTFLVNNYKKTLPTLALIFLALQPTGNMHFLLTWTLGLLGALLMYQLCLLLILADFPQKRFATSYTYFEKNIFRFYLFHMPVSLLLSRKMIELGVFPPWLNIIFTFILTIILTIGLVYCSHHFEKTQLPKIFNGMRPKD